MFYLINEKDGLFGEMVLVNAINLQSLEVETDNDKEESEVIFRHKHDENSISFDSNNIFNVNKVINNIADMKQWYFENPYIVLSDIENVENIQHVFGKNSELCSKLSTILINIYDIGLVYEEDGQYILTTPEKNFTIGESPEEVLSFIKEKIITLENVDDKRLNRLL